MKKIFIWFLSGIILVFISSYVNYEKYASDVNSFVSGVVSVIHDEYPDIKDEDIINVINSKKRNNSEVLKRYGFLVSDISYLNSMERVYKKNIILNISIFLGFSVVFGGYIFYKKYKYNKEILNITNYLKKINEGVYDLDIIDNVEGDLSILKNEVYTTTVSLKECFEKEYDERIKIKDNLANISHQLKTPLTSIMLMVDTMLEEDVPESVRNEFLESIRNQIDNINFLVIEILKLSKLDANIVKFNKDKVNVLEMINKCLNNLKSDINKKNINVNICVPDNLYFIGDFNWECEAYTNLIKNAVENIEDNSNIFISSELIGNILNIYIMDDGVGINEEDKKHIFERFYKGVNSKNNNFGIGLSLAKEIINKDGGVIKLDDSLVGTKFKIKYYIKKY